jgi:hypothetical protein
MISHVLKLGEINKGFDLMHEGKSIRSVIVYQPEFGPCSRSNTREDWL